MTNGEMFGLICAAGAAGGVVHDLLAGGLTAPSTSTGADSRRQWDPGTLGSIVLGAIAAGLSWALYGPLAGATIGSGRTPGTVVALTWGALAGALLVGAAGTRWIRAEIEKRFFKAAAVTASQAPADPSVVGAMTTASGRDALALARDMTQPARLGAPVYAAPDLHRDGHSLPDPPESSEPSPPTDPAANPTSP
ncbi:MAG TPA: hypothetical protein VFU94_06665 [Conexibacter sp.]|nr:hypothetical protein [Conexibacter sp.]